MKKLLLRILMTIGSLTILIIAVSFFLELKLKESYQNENEWTWFEENQTIYNMLKNKNLTEENELFPLVLNKNFVIPEKEIDEKRILVIGDSFVWGYGGTNVNYTWWKQLNLQIKKAGYSNVNIYAAGRYFINTKDQLEKILKNDKLIEKIDPDLIIIGYVTNDPEERNQDNTENLIKTLWQQTPEDNKLYKKFPGIYKMLEKIYYLVGYDYNKLKFMGDMLGKYRDDIWRLMIASNENLERYKDVLIDVDKKVKELDVPYFYYFTDNTENPFVNQALTNVYNTMQDLDIKAYYTPYEYNKIKPNIKNVDAYSQYINPADYHPGIIWAHNCGNKVFELLMQDYKFIFENPIMEDLDKLELNINDTMPFLHINKVKKNTFEFEYPKKELIKNMETTNFLYYPIKKNYVKLNLEYPKNVSKIKITGENIKNVDVYVNTINQELGYDLDEARQVVTPSKKIDENIYEVGYEITSLNISIEFFDESNRNIKVEFIEG